MLERFCRARGGLTLLLLAALSPGILADEEPASDSSPTQSTPPTDQDGAYFSWEEAIDTGFVFVNGTYIEPPYVLESVNRELVVNGVETGHVFELAVRSRRRYHDEDAAGRQSPRQFRNPLATIVEILECEGAVILFDGEAPFQVEVEAFVREVFPMFVDKSPEQAGRWNRIQTWLPAGSDRSLWSQWFRSYTPPPSLVSRVQTHEAQWVASEARNGAEIRARQRLETWAYPLSTLGLVLVVIAFGHLLSGRPQAAASAYDVDASLEALRAVNYSVLLILALSTLDLVWTLLAAQAGGMKELNPLGSRLIHDPDLLIGFKLLATVTAVGIVLIMRRFRRVQLASWWMCLICTVLAVRWLTYNSMFV